MVLRASSVFLLAFSSCGASVLGGDVLSTRPLVMTTDGGEPCTPKSQRGDWPVKVVFVVQNTGSMCVADAPGSTGASGLCETIAPPTGVTQPARVRAIRAFLDANATRSNVSVALVVFGLNPKVVGFNTPAELQGPTAALQSTLVGTPNLQGALAATRRLIEDDVASTAQSVRARTRYVVVVLGTGVPSPRCAANDALPMYATPTDPELVWADAPGLAEWCNLSQASLPSSQRLDGFVPGSALNQNAQLSDAVDAIIDLDRAYGLGDVRLHARLVFSARAVSACGPICNDLFGGLTVSQARSVGTFTSSLLALHGQGTFLDPGEPDALEVSMSTIDTAEFTTFCE